VYNAKAYEAIVISLDSQRHCTLFIRRQKMSFNTCTSTHSDCSPYICLIWGLHVILNLLRKIKALHRMD